jgi:hypothetical protein
MSKNLVRGDRNVSISKQGMIGPSLCEMNLEKMQKKQPKSHSNRRSFNSKVNGKLKGSDVRANFNLNFNVHNSLNQFLTQNSCHSTTNRAQKEKAKNRNNLSIDCKNKHFIKKSVMDGRELYGSVATEKFKDLISSGNIFKKTSNTANPDAKKLRKVQKSDFGVRMSAENFPRPNTSTKLAKNSQPAPLRPTPFPPPLQSQPPSKPYPKKKKPSTPPNPSNVTNIISNLTGIYNPNPNPNNQKNSQTFDPKKTKNLYSFSRYDKQKDIMLSKRENIKAKILGNKDFFSGNFGGLENKENDQN